MTKEELILGFVSFLHKMNFDNDLSLNALKYENGKLYNENKKKYIPLTNNEKELFNKLFNGDIHFTYEEFNRVFISEEKRLKKLNK